MCMDCAHVALAAVPAVSVAVGKLKIRAAYTLLGKQVILGRGLYSPQADRYVGEHWIVNAVSGSTRWHTATLAYVGRSEAPHPSKKIRVGLLLDALAAGLIEEV